MQGYRDLITVLKAALWAIDSDSNETTEIKQEIPRALMLMLM
jgi:hypothetical protein